MSPLGPAALTGTLPDLVLLLSPPEGLGRSLSTPSTSSTTACMGLDTQGWDSALRRCRGARMACRGPRPGQTLLGFHHWVHPLGWARSLAPH